MAESFFPFDAGPGAAVLESQWQRMARQWLSTGVIAAYRNLLVVSANGAAMSVAVATGGAWVEGFWYDTDAALDRAIGAADAAQPRIDTVVLRLDRAANAMTVAVVAGVAAAAPAVPALTQTDALWELPLADVRVDAAVGVIVAGKVTDRRKFTGPFDSAAYVDVTGGDTITAAAPATVPLTVKGAAGQTGNLFEARDAAGTVVSSSSGEGDQIARRLRLSGLEPAVNFALGIQAGNVGGVGNSGLLVRGAAGQTGNLAEFQNSAGTVLANVASDGQIIASMTTDGATLLGEPKRFLAGPADSAGAGFRTVRVFN